MVKSIRLTRFKRFKDTEIRLRPFTVLVGENDCGKTTVLQALYLALHGLHEGGLLSVDLRSQETRVSSTGYYMFRVPFVPQDDLNGLFYRKISRGSATYDENSGAVLTLRDEKENSIRIHMRELFKNLNVKVLTPEEELHTPELQKYAPLYITGFSGLRYREERLYPAVLDDRLDQGEISAQLRNLILELRKNHADKYRRLDQILQDELNLYLSGQIMRGDGKTAGTEEAYVSVGYEEGVPEQPIGLELGSCGSGTLQILQIVASILWYCPEKTRVVLIDEPEAHLHPKLQHVLGKILQELQEELSIQIIMATHSEAIIADTDVQNVICVSSGASVNTGADMRDDSEQTEESGQESGQMRAESDYEQLSLF